MPEKVKLNLVGLDSNAFALIGAFKNAARKQGWASTEINAVTAECMKGDYNHLLCTLMANTESEDDNEGDNEDSWGDE